MTDEPVQPLHIPLAWQKSTPTSRGRSRAPGQSSMPKSSLVLTRPTPKKVCQALLTATRAVSGCSGRHELRARGQGGLACILRGTGEEQGYGETDFFPFFQVFAPDPDDVRSLACRRHAHDLRHLVGSVCFASFSAAVTRRFDPAQSFPGNELSLWQGILEDIRRRLLSSSALAARALLFGHCSLRSAAADSRAQRLAAFCSLAQVASINGGDTCTLTTGTSPPLSLTLLNAARNGE